MKLKIQLSKGLKLNHQSLTKLQESQMLSVRGGSDELAEEASSKGPKCTCGKGSCV